MKVLVTGANGQLGQEVVKLLQKNNIQCLPCSKEDMDITSKQSVQDKVITFQPNVIIHTAAYTHVDLAETNKDKAFSVNGLGTRNVAEVAEEIGAVVCYISTDYVFDGQSRVPYSEDSQPNPMTIYGKAKYEGEQYVRSICSHYFILRTSWVFGSNGQNFVKTILKLSKEKSSIQVVSDQFGSPTYTVDLAAFIYNLIQTNLYGVYHVTNSGDCSWYDFAKSIVRISGRDVTIEPVDTQSFPRPAPRPKYSVLKHANIQANNLPDLQHWQEALHAFLNEMGEVSNGE
ncbi:dTDP-4-dehydrorhamnose reductase [Metabacillus halosaccharovorans]|uniref:dTDP-4-dehydrorhamnose reductase n=1 Tax=Metabacillus halosaccharovorans TaxID=930124 RepID=UPI0034CDDFB2